MTRFGVILIHEIQEMANALNLDCDQVGTDGAHSDSDDFLFNPTGRPDPDERITTAVLGIVTSKVGVGTIFMTHYICLDLCLFILLIFVTFIFLLPGFFRRNC